MSSFYMYHYCSFITTRTCSQQHYNSDLNEADLTCIFSIRLISLVLRNTGQHLSICIWVILNTEIISKAQTMWNQTDHQKETCLLYKK